MIIRLLCGGWIHGWTPVEIEIGEFQYVIACHTKRWKFDFQYVSFIDSYELVSDGMTVLRPGVEPATSR